MVLTVAESSSGGGSLRGGGTGRSLSVPTATTTTTKHDIVPMSQRTIDYDMTWLRDCRKYKLYNATWGKTVAPFVDKVGTKKLIHSWDTTTVLKTVPNIAVYTPKNFSLFTPSHLANLRDGILKPAQGTGQVARIHNDSYTCFKWCHGPEHRHSFSWHEDHNSDEMSGSSSSIDLTTAHGLIRDTMKKLLFHFPGKTFTEREPQYKFTPHRVVIEERLPVETMREYHWWVVHGHPVYVCVRCDEGGEKRGSYYSTDFHELAIQNFDHNCTGMSKPPMWDEMLLIVEQLGSHIEGIVSIDLYASDTEVYFSEFTFTRNICKTDSSPKIVDALLYFADHKLIKPHQMTAQFVEQTLADRSWVQVALDSNDVRFPDTPSMFDTQSYPSSFDLCKNMKEADADERKRCLQTVDPIKQYSLHCVASKNGALLPVGIWKDDRFRRIFAKIDWFLAAGLAGLWVFCKISFRGLQKRHQVWNCFMYLGVVALYKWYQDSTQGLIAPTSLWTTVTEAWHAFTVVHPVSSPAIALSHMATYWVSVAAFRSKCLQSMLIYWFCYEVATSFINEYFHFGEEDDGVHCARVTFIAAARHYAINDVMRIYLMPPILVYGYLLPKMVLHWLGAL